MPQDPDQEKKKLQRLGSSLGDFTNFQESGSQVPDLTEKFDLKKMQENILKQAENVGQEKQTQRGATPGYNVTDLHKVSQGPIRPLKFMDTSAEKSPVKLGKPLVDPSEQELSLEDMDINLEEGEISEKAELKVRDDGGVYISDPKSKKPQVNRPNDSERRQLLRHGLDPDHYEIDHIAPLEFGGVDAPPNKQVLFWKDHRKKTKVQAVARRLLGMGEINLDQARELTMTWENKPVEDIPMEMLERGHLPNTEDANELAREYKNYWQKKEDGELWHQKLSKKWDEFKKENLQPENVGEEVLKASGLAAGINLLDDEVDDEEKKPKGDPSEDDSIDTIQKMVGESASSAGEALTAGWVELPDTEYDTKQKENLAKIGEFAGALAGNIGGIVASGGVLRGAASLLKYGGKAAKWGAKASKANKVLSKVPFVSKAAKNVANSNKARKILKSGDLIAKGDKFKFPTNKLTSAFKTGAAYSLYGQASYGSQVFDSDKEWRLDRALERMAFDMSTGALDATVSPGLKESFGYVGFPTFLGSYAVMGNGMQTAFQEGMTAAGMHYLFERPKHKQAMRKAASKFADQRYDQLTDTLLRLTPRHGKKSLSEKKITELKIDKESDSKEEIQKKLEEQAQVISNNISRSLGMGQISDTQARNLWDRWRQHQKYQTGDVTLEPQSLVEELWADGKSIKKKLEHDLKNYGAKSSYPRNLKKWIARNSGRFDMDANEFDLTKQERRELEGLKGLVTEEEDVRMMLTGAGLSDDAPLIRDNALDIIEAHQNGENVDIVAVKNPEAAPFIERANETDPRIKSGDKPKYDPESVLSAYARVGDDFKYVGSFPTKERIQRMNKRVKDDPNLDVETFNESKHNRAVSARMGEHGIKALEFSIDTAKVAKDSNKPYLIVESKPGDWRKSIESNYKLDDVTSPELNKINDTLADEVLNRDINPVRFLDDYDANTARAEAYKGQLVSYLRDIQSMARAGDVDGLYKSIKQNLGDVTTKQEVDRLIQNPEDLTLDKVVNDWVFSENAVENMNKNAIKFNRGLGSLLEKDGELASYLDEMREQPLLEQGDFEELTNSQLSKLIVDTKSVLSNNETPIYRRRGERSAQEKQNVAENISEQAGTLAKPEDVQPVRPEQQTTAEGQPQDEVIQLPPESTPESIRPEQAQTQTQQTPETEFETIQSSKSTEQGETPQTGGRFMVEDNLQDAKPINKPKETDVDVERTPETKAKKPIEPDVEQLSEVKEGQVEQTKETSPNFDTGDIQFNKSPEEIQPDDFTKFSDSENVAYSNLIGAKQKQAIEAGDTQRANELQDIRGNLNQTKLTKKARDAEIRSSIRDYRKKARNREDMEAVDDWNDIEKELEEGNLSDDARDRLRRNGDAQQAFENYKSYVKEQLDEAGVDYDFEKYANQQALRKQFLRSKNYIKRKRWSVDEQGRLVWEEGNFGVESQFEKRKREFLADNPEIDSDQLMVSNFDPKNTVYPSDVNSLEQKKDFLSQKLAENGYYLAGIKANNLDSAVAVKHSPQLAQRFDPEKHLAEGESLTQADTREEYSLEQERGFRVFLNEVLGVPVSAKSVPKRWNLLVDNELMYEGPEKSVKHIVLPSPRANDVNLPEGMEKNPALFDGKFYVTPGLMDEIGKQMGSQAKNTFRLKPGSTVHRAEGTGGVKNMFLHKGDGARLTDAAKKQIEDMTGASIPDGEVVVTFMDNVKIGKENYLPNKGNRKNLPVGTMYEVDIPLSSYSFKSTPEPTPNNKISSQVLSHFRHNPDNNFGEELKQIHQKEFQKWKEFNSDIKEAKTSDELGKVLRNWKDEYGYNPENILHGNKKTLFAHGGGRRAVGEERISDFLNKLFRDRVLSLSGVVRNSYGRMTPDAGFYSKGSAEKQFLQPGEIMISKEKANELGVSEGDELLTYRYPVSKKSNMVMQKVRVADNYYADPNGNNPIDYLGKQHVITNQYDTWVKQEGDYDGDSIYMVKVGGDDGMPKSIKQEVRRNSEPLEVGEMESYKNTTPSLANLHNIIDGQILGQEATQITTRHINILPQLKDNGINIDFSKPFRGQGGNLKRKMDVKANDGVLFSQVVDVDQGAVNDSFNLEFDDSQETRQYLAKVLQGAVDSAKKRGLQNMNWTPKDNIEAITNVEGTNSAAVSDAAWGQVSNTLNNWIMPYNSIFKGPGRNQLRSLKSYIAREGKKPMSEVDINENKGYDSSKDLKQALDLYNVMLRKIEKAGGDLTPIQQAVRDLNDFDPYNIKDNERVGADYYAMKKMREDKGELLDTSKEASPEIKALKQEATKTLDRLNNADEAGFALDEKSIQNMIDKVIKDTSGLSGSQAKKAGRMWAGEFRGPTENTMAQLERMGIDREAIDAASQLAQKQGKVASEQRFYPFKNSVKNTLEGDISNDTINTLVNASKKTLPPSEAKLKREKIREEFKQEYKDTKEQLKRRVENKEPYNQEDFDEDIRKFTHFLASSPEGNAKAANKMWEKGGTGNVVTDGNGNPVRWPNNYVFRYWDIIKDSPEVLRKYLSYFEDLSPTKAEKYYGAVKGAIVKKAGNSGYDPKNLDID